MKTLTEAMRRALFADDGHGRLDATPRTARALRAGGLLDDRGRVSDFGRQARALEAIELASVGLRDSMLWRYLRDPQWALGQIAAGRTASDQARLDEALGLFDYEVESTGPGLRWARLAVVLPWPLGELSFRWRSLTHGDPLPMSPMLRRTIDAAERGTITLRGMRRAQAMFYERMRAAERRGLPSDGWVEALALASTCELGLPGGAHDIWTSPLSRTVAWWSEARGLVWLKALAVAVEEYRAADTLELIAGMQKVRRVPQALKDVIGQWARDAARAPKNVEADRLAAMLWSGEPLIDGAVHWFDGGGIRRVPLAQVEPVERITTILDFERASAADDFPRVRSARAAARLLDDGGRVSVAHGLTPKVPRIEADGAVWWFHRGELVQAPLLAEGALDFANTAPADPDFWPESDAFRAWLARHGAES